MAERRNIRYSALSTSPDDPHPAQSIPDLRFNYSPSDRVPWKSIALALFLLFFGTLSLVLSYLIFSGHMGGDSSQAYGFLTIGMLLFLPGFYETRIAYYSTRGAKGYRFSQIPDY